MTKNKIDYPFKVPEGFFEEFKEEMTAQFIQVEHQHQKKRKLLIGLLKYAAIVIVSFFIGRESMRLSKNWVDSTDQQMTDDYTIDEIYSQINQEDLTEYIMETNPDEIMAQ